MVAHSIDKQTKRWIRDESDEYAAHIGYKFNEERGQFVVDWLRDYLVLYEGDAAGQPFECHDWQYEATMRLFGWVIPNCPDWGGERRRFKKAIIFIPKKNKKSPTLSAWCTYHFCGDGVMGQKCFPTAVDGAQIRENVGRHIHEMILQSDALSAECKINKTTGGVFHEPTRSLILPLSSDNVRSQKAKEGLNGSVFVDEVHVVNRAHMRRISRAGISRPEPLQVEVSTAGDEPESYGMGRFRYAESIIAGITRDPQTLAMIYAAPQDITDDEIHKDPVKCGKLANPAWGHTIKEKEFLNDYNESKRTIADFCDFKKYRLNIWQQSSSPWISVHDWRKCEASDYPLSENEVTYGGLDLSRLIDLTAWVLYQPELKKCWGHYWCPRQRALELSGQFEIPMLDWEAQGWLTLCEEGSIPRRVVHDRLARDAETYPHLKYVGYDRALMSDTVPYCRDEFGWEMVDLAQGVMTLNAPSRLLEEMVANHELDHSNDPVLEWMLQNTSVRPDSNGNIKPLKNPDGVRKHIDGIAALVNAIALTILHPEDGPSVYETPGMLSL